MTKIGKITYFTKKSALSIADFEFEGYATASSMIRIEGEQNSIFFYRDADYGHS